MAIPASLTAVLPAVNAPKSLAGAVYGAGVPLVIGYGLYKAGMPEDATEWVITAVLALVALGFALNFVSTQIAAAPAATA